MQERNNRSSRQHEIWTRVISLLLSTLMIISIAGCGTTPDAEPTSEPTQSTAPTTPAVEQTTEPVEAEVPTGTAQDENADATEVETAPIETEAVKPEVIPNNEEPEATEAPAETETPAPTETTAPTETPAPTEAPKPIVTIVEPEEPSGLSSTQQNAINMLNYMTVLTQRINDSKGSRVYLESEYSSLINNIYPNAVDSKTQAQINSILDTLEGYRMIAVKRDRLEFIYEQNRAQAFRQAIPNPVALLSAVQSGSLLKAAVSVIYMAVDSASSYSAATSQADMQYLKDGWDLDDAESAELHNSRKAAFNYMLNMVRDNDLPGDLALNEDAVSAFVEWANNGNLVRKTSWLETNESTYENFGPYWLELAMCYYDAAEYEKCLGAIETYESVTTRIFRKDHDYANALPMAIISAQETMDTDSYIEAANTYAKGILDNTADSDWALRYFVAQIYLDLYSKTSDTGSLQKAYKIAYDNVNILVDDQRELNAAYLADVVEIKAESGATKREKEEVKQYNKMLKAERKVAVPPVNEALYLNCDLLFALADELNIDSREQAKIDAILHENGENIFLTEALDNRFRFASKSAINADSLTVDFNGKELKIPAVCICDRSTVTVTINSSNGKTTISDWTVKEVVRPKNAGCSDFMVTFISETAKDYKFQAGDTIVITVTPVQKASREVIAFNYEVVAVKKAFVFNGIEFERKTK